MSIFTCCQREDESKYLHGPCGCPSATFVCESEEINPALCGFSESDGYESTPPKKYLEVDVVASGEFTNYYSNGGGPCDKCDGKLQLRYTWGGSGSVSYSADNCSTTTNSDNGPWAGEDSWYCTFAGGDCSDPDSYDYIADSNNGETVVIWSALGFNGTPISSTEKETISNASNPSDSREITSTLSQPDTDDNAVARETPVSSTSCSSLWETRSTDFSWVKRTSGYTINCSKLVVGLEYEVTPAIRKRTAVIGSYGAWEDVTVTPVTFTATDTTHTIDDEGEPIDLDHIQGWEYEITGVNIEKTA